MPASNEFEMKSAIEPLAAAPLVALNEVQDAAKYRCDNLLVASSMLCVGAFCLVYLLP